MIAAGARKGRKNGTGSGGGSGSKGGLRYGPKGGGTVVEASGAQPGLFTARANEPDEAQILIFSMYMDES